MPRYEYSEDGGVTGSHKFWEVSVQGTQMTVRFGRIGSRGQTQVKSFASPQEAYQAAEKISAEKLRKGYRVVDGTGPAPAPPPPAAPPTTEATNPELEAALQRNPDDDQACLVLADWLQTQGDPRGELISIQHAMKGLVDAARFLELKKAEAALIQANEARFFGALVPVLHLVKVTWRHGFFHAATVRGEDQKAREQLFDCPSARLLQVLTLDPVGSATNYDTGLDILRRRRPPTLRALNLGDPRIGRTTVLVGPLAPLASALPRLQRLAVLGSEASFEGVKLPELRRLEIHLADLATALPALLAGDWQHLEHLELRSPRAIADAALLKPLLAPGRFRSLKHLVVHNLDGPASDALVEALLESPLLKQLEELILSSSAVSDEVAKAVVAHRADLPQLKKLELWGQFAAATSRALQKAFPAGRFMASVRQPAGRDDDERYDEIEE